VAVPAQFIGFACGPFTKSRNLLYQGDVISPQDRPEIKVFITERLSEYLEPTMLPNESPNISKYWVSDVSEKFCVFYLFCNFINIIIQLLQIINWFIEKFPFSVPNNHPHHSSSSYPALKDLYFPFKALNIAFVEGAYHDISVTAGLVICKYVLIDILFPFLIF
jgi:hypothetical protein